MQKGIKEEIDFELEQYYDKYYDILRTPDFDDKSRLLKPKHRIQTIGTPINKKCRFAEKMRAKQHFQKLLMCFLSVLAI